MRRGIKTNFLFSCEIRFWSLHLRDFGVREVNTAWSNKLKRSFVLNKRTIFGAKIFTHLRYCNFRVEVFFLNHPVFHVKEISGRPTKYCRDNNRQSWTDVKTMEVGNLLFTLTTGDYGRWLNFVAFPFVRVPQRHLDYVLRCVSRHCRLYATDSKSRAAKDANDSSESGLFSSGRFPCIRTFVSGYNTTLTFNKLHWKMSTFTGLAVMKQAYVITVNNQKQYSTTSLTAYIIM